MYLSIVPLEVFLSESFPYKGVLLDIEGTTTPVTFVYDVLFPYARRAMQGYLEAHWDAPGFQELKQQILANIAEINAGAAGEGAPEVDAAASGEALRAAVMEHLKWQMSKDQKNSPLKALQGRMWRAGYEDGELNAPVYADVVEALSAWQAQGTPVYIYSSGSVPAQILLFKYSEHGDLGGYLSGYFDTKTGPKKEADSYTKICEEVGVEPAAMLFVTDNIDEAKAADRAGLKVAVAKRPGNAPIEVEHGFDVIETFGPISPA
ncbi:acireductone synthase [Bradymonas sediminis]|uniref:Enolase-phosphatase E1 n=1 Tax=Bradymonas sediminis TaxID=1548548 RepID=A0A2Z4FGE6_9DELT|nr:acireductone synthase [Bradymonas sediminis]